MKQLTLRGFGPELARRLQAVARERSISLNRAALLLMRRGAGLATPSERAFDEISRPVIGSGLDRFIGVWSEEEESEFLHSIEDVEEIDPEIWE